MMPLRRVFKMTRVKDRTQLLEDIKTEKQIKCKLCKCILPKEHFEEGDICPKCDDMLYDARMEMAESKGVEL